MKVLLNNKLKDLKKIDLDTGYFYGYGVFETIYIREGQGVLVEEHLKRLNEALIKLNINKSVTVEEVDYAIAVLRLYNVALKINVSEDNVLFSTRPITYKAEHYKAGAKLKLSNVFRNPTSPAVSIKSMNYLDNIYEMQAARREGYNDVLFTNYEGMVCETAVANIFWIKGDQVYTPSLECGLLDGIIRSWIVQRYDVSEVKVAIEALKEADGVFITNSLMGIMKVESIDDVTLSQSEGVKELTRAYVEYLKESGESGE